METPLSKKTKAELISAYEDLLAKQEGVQSVAKETYTPENKKLFETARTYTPEAVEKTALELRSTITDAIGLFIEAFESEAKKFDDLRKAVDLAQERLKLHHNLEASATVLQEIISEHEKRRDELESMITTRKRDWEREQEELEYETKITRSRKEAVDTEERKKKDLLLKEREEALVTRETELADLRKRVEAFPTELEKETEKITTNVRKELDIEHKRHVGDKEREHEYTKKMFEVEKKTLQQEIARQTTEIVTLRKDAELANKKAQDLATRIIESRTDRGHTIPSTASVTEGTK